MREVQNLSERDANRTKERVRHLDDSHLRMIAALQRENLELKKNVERLDAALEKTSAHTFPGLQDGMRSLKARWMYLHLSHLMSRASMGVHVREGYLRS